MMNFKKIFLLVLLLCPVLLNAEDSEMVITEALRCVNDSQDARINKMDDGNGNLCALLKITLSDPSQANSFYVNPGGYTSIVKREIEPNSGELWYWLPANIQSLTLTCKDHKPYKMNVQLSGGKVYRMTVQLKSRGTVLIDPDKYSDYVKFNVSPQKARVYWGYDTDFKEFSEVDNGVFATDILIEYGKVIYVKVVPENKLYEPYETSFLWSGQQLPDVLIQEAFNKISITTEPGDADIYVDENKVTDFSTRKFPKGTHHLTIKKSLWYSVDRDIELSGDGTTIPFTFTLKPRSANATINCPDPLAELFIDDEKSPCGKGEVTLRLSSGTHRVSSRRPNYASQTVSLTVLDGVDCTCNVPVPVPLYGFINVMTNPKGCEVYVDNEYVGTSPMLYKCISGNHTVTLNMDGYASKKKTVQVEYNSKTSVNETLSFLTGSAAEKAAKEKAAREEKRKEDEYSTKFKNKGLASSIDFSYAYSVKSGYVEYEYSGRRPYGSLSPLQLTYTLSYKFNRHCSLGIGTGVLFNAKSLTITNDNFCSTGFTEKRIDVPIFLNLRINFMRAPIRPFVSLDAGCYVLSKTFMGDLGVGCEFRLNRTLGLRVQVIGSFVPWPDFSLTTPKYYSTFAPGIKVGFDF